MWRPKTSALVTQVILLWLTAPAHAQQTNNATSYFLIDISGSMRDRDAEARVSDILDPIKSSNPSALVSRTYFRAVNQSACHTPVVISSPVAAQKSAPEAVAFLTDDFTPLGAALRSAILHAVKSGAPANIYLISDLDQTPGCGVDVCTVASALLPIDGISVQVKPATGTNAINRDRVGCIEAAQWRPVPAERHESETKYREIKRTPLEQWFWLIGFAVLAAGAAGFGWRNSRHALYVENQTSEAREGREAIRLGETGAKESFETLRVETLDKIKTHTWHWSQVAYWLLIIAGGTGLFMLAALPDEYFGGGVLKAKQAAWKVLDSNFSTAFAGIWIALFYFWAAQSQRSDEAARNFAMVTKEADRIAVARKSKAEQDQFDEYKSMLDMVSNLPFKMPLSQGDDEIVSAFEVVAAKARRIAIQQELKSSDDQNEILSETARLKGLASPANWLERTPDFETFVRRLLRSKTIASADTDWADLANAIAGSNVQKIHEKLRALSVELTSGR